MSEPLEGGRGAPEETAAELAHVAERARVLFEEHLAGVRARVDRMFAVVLGLQLVGAIALAVTGSADWEVVGLGGAPSALAILLALRRPGRAPNGFVIAAAQILWSALLVPLAGDHLDARSYVLVSLAFLSLYRDWRVLAWATVIALAAHGRSLELVGWIAFEDVVLVVACLEGVTELRAIAERSAEVDWQCRLFSAIDRTRSEDLARAIKELEESQEARARTDKLAAVGQLAASVGHELRNPLAAVRNAATYLRRRLTDPKSANLPATDDPKIAQFLELMFRELDVSAKIIADLLDFARERKPVLAPCPLRQLVAEAIEVIPNSGVRVTNEVPETLPVPNLDKDQFRQILVNLVQNAMEAATGTKDARVIVRAEGGEGDQPWQLHVVDNGIGMTKEVLEKVFQPLYTTKVKGTGLGLAVVSGLVKAHGGTIKAESEEGRGSRFTIVLPRHPVRFRESVASFPAL